MKHRAIVGASALALLLGVGICGATMFCGSGSDGKPDRPCDEDLDNAQAVATKYETRWKSISGVASVYVFQEETVNQVIVRVEPSSLADSVESVLPSEVEGYPVRVVSIPEEPESNGGAHLASNHFRYGNIKPCGSNEQMQDGDSGSSPSEVDTRAYDDVMSDPDTESWLDLPGVLSIGPKKCGECDCIPLQVVVTVQSAMLESVRAQLPPSKFGVQIEAAALEGRPIEEAGRWGRFIH